MKNSSIVRLDVVLIQVTFSASLVSPTIAIYRYDAPLLFLNSDLFINKALNLVDDKLVSYPFFQTVSCIICQKIFRKYINEY